MRRNYHRKLWGEIITGNYEEKLSLEIILKIIKNHATFLKEFLHGAKEGGREGYRERVKEIEGNRERDGEWEKEKYTHVGKHQRTIH